MYVPDHFRLPEERLEQILASPRAGNLVTTYEDGPRAPSFPSTWRPGTRDGCWSPTWSATTRRR